LLKKSQIKHIFAGYIELINTFTQRPAESNWDVKLIMWVENNLWIDKWALETIAGINWVVSSEPVYYD